MEGDDHLVFAFDEDDLCLAVRSSRRHGLTLFCFDVEFNFIVAATVRQSRGAVENADFVKIGSERYPVTRSKKKQLRKVAFVFDGNTIMGIEQNPKTKSRWAKMARSAKKVMQFIQEGRYVAVVADGKVTLYGKRRA
ncbi:MAG: hypothetical protein WAN72_01360 [Candidatus Acidiferrales bacterium]